MKIISYKDNENSIAIYLVKGKMMINNIYVDKNNTLQNKYIKACMSNGCKLTELAKASTYFKSL